MGPDESSHQEIEPRPPGITRRVRLELRNPGDQPGVARQARMRAGGGGLLLGKEGGGGGATDTRRVRDVPMATGATASKMKWEEEPLLALFPEEASHSGPQCPHLSSWGLD